MSKDNKNHIYIYIVVVISIIAAISFFIIKNVNNKKEEQKNKNESTNVTRLATKTNVLEENEKLNETNNKIENIIQNDIKENTVKEEELSTYSTKLTSSTDGRLTNVKITCNKLNGVTVAAGDTFSFCKTTGPSKAEEGYKEATVFLNGKEIQALGGGNCQVSSTLYNAVLAVKELEVVERHEHGRKVHYVPENKDATVSYGSLDFKFKNNTQNTIKLYFTTDDKTLTVRIVKLV